MVRRIKIFSNTNIPLGIKFSGISCGIKNKNKKDLGLIYADSVIDSYTVFTKNQIKAAPVIVGLRKRKKNFLIKSIIVNSGNANCCTGEEGIVHTISIAKSLSKILNISSNEILVCSTGIIGEPLPVDKIERGIPRLVSQLDSSYKALINFSRSILTTDTKEKIVVKYYKTRKGVCKFIGIAKGAGMIYPNMATMLAFIVSDANIKKGVCKKILPKVVDNTFNRINVDGHTSTNDTVVLLSTGQGISISQKVFYDIVLEICEELSYKIIEDAEGSTKIVRVEVEGARSLSQADAVARLVANALLVKTAIHGEDPNWGRIISAAGMYPGISDKVDIFLNDILIVKDSYPIVSKQKMQTQMKRKHINIKIKVGKGKAHAHILTSDISEEYVKINADYHT